MFLIAGAKVRTFPLPAKHSDDFFSGRKHPRARKALGENTLGQEKKSRAGNGRRNGGERRRGAEAEGTPYYYGARKVLFAICRGLSP